MKCEECLRRDVVVNEVFDNLILGIQKLRGGRDAEIVIRGDSNAEEDCGPADMSQEILRLRKLEDAICKAVNKLEETKKSFKSQKVKEVRESLSSLINS